MSDEIAVAVSVQRAARSEASFSFIQAIMSDWQMNLHEALRLSSDCFGKYSKLWECQKQRRLVVNKKYTSQKLDIEETANSIDQLILNVHK